MMEEDGDDFGTLYSDLLKPCSTVKQPNFFNDHKPFNFHATTDFSANAFKDLNGYDEFLLSECKVDGGKLLPECKVDDEFDDVIFDVEMEQNEAEIDGRGLDGDNEINNVLVDVMDIENDDLEPEYLRSSTGGDNVDEEESESDESFDIIIDDDDLNDHNIGSDKKYAEKKELGLLRIGSFNDLDDLDDLEPGEIPGMNAELGTDVEARFGQSYQSFHTESKGARSVFMSQTFDDSKAEQNQVNPVRNAKYNFGGTRFRHLPAHFRRAFNLEDDYSGYKPWERPGVNLSHYFNFDLDEDNWQNYCKQMKELLQTSPPSKAVGYKREQPQLKNTPAKRIGEAIQVLISRSERVACLQNHHQRECDSDAIIEIVFVDSPDDTESFTKDLKDRALCDHKKCPTTIHKIVGGDKILPFPLDGSFHRIYHEERVSINYAQEGSRWKNFESMVSKKQDHISHQDWSKDLDHPNKKSEAEQGPHGALVKYDKVMPLYSNKDVRKNNKGQTTVQNRLKDVRFHNSGEKSWREGDRNYKKSLKQPDESKTTSNVFDNNEITGNGFENHKKRMEQTFSQTDHQERNSDNKLNKGIAVNEGDCRMRIEDTIYQTDHQEGNNDTKLNKGSAVEDNCKMRIEETVSQTDHQKGDNDNKLNKRSPVNKDNCRKMIRKGIDETLSKTDDQEGNDDNKLNKGSVVDKDNFKMRIEETVSRTDRHIGNNDNKLNKGNAVKKEKCRMRMDETLSEIGHQEVNNDNKLNKGSAIDEDNCRMRIEKSSSLTEHKEGNNDNKLNKGSEIDKDNYRMRIKESETDHQEGNNDNKCNKGRAVDEDNCRMRKEETLFETDHQEGNNDNKLNNVDEDNCRMRIEETLLETDNQEGNNDNKLNKERAVDEDFNGEQQLTEPIDNHEQEFPDNCNLATNLGNDVVFDDQKHEAEREENVDEVQGSPRARESCRDEIKQLMSNIKGFMTEVDELVYGNNHEHEICCLR